MAAKRKSKGSPKPTDKGPAVHVDRDEIDSTLLAPVEPVPTEPETAGRAAKPAVPKAGPVPRTGRLGRGQATPQARRYAFRRS